MTRRLKSRFRSRPRRSGGGVFGDLCNMRRWMLFFFAFCMSSVMAFVISGLVLSRRTNVMGMVAGEYGGMKTVGVTPTQGEEGQKRSVRSLIVDRDEAQALPQIEVGISPNEVEGEQGENTEEGNDGEGNGKEGNEENESTVEAEAETVFDIKKKEIPEGPIPDPVQLKDELFTGHCGKNSRERYLFSTGFRAPVFSAIKGVNNFIRVANGTDRTLVGPFINHEFSFKMSRVIDARETAPDYIGKYFNLLRFFDVYNNFCSLTAGIEADMVCPDPKDRVHVCIGVKCNDGGYLMDVPPEEQKIQNDDDLVNTLRNDPRLNNAKCLIIHNYQKGVQDEFMKKKRYPDLYDWSGGKPGMDASWWIYDMFSISNEMKTLAQEYRNAVGLTSDEYYAIHLRPETVAKYYCDRLCGCTLDNIAKIATATLKEQFPEHSGPFYVAWDVRFSTGSKVQSLVANAKIAMEEVLTSESMRLLSNYMDPPSEVFSDILNLVHAKECLTLGGGTVAAAVNFERVNAGKPPCRSVKRLAKNRYGECKFLVL